MADLAGIDYRRKPQGLVGMLPASPDVICIISRIYA